LLAGAAILPKVRILAFFVAEFCSSWLWNWASLLLSWLLPALLLWLASVFRKLSRLPVEPLLSKALSFRGALVAPTRRYKSASEAALPPRCSLTKASLPVALLSKSLISWVFHSRVGGSSTTDNERDEDEDEDVDDDVDDGGANALWDAPAAAIEGRRLGARDEDVDEDGKDAAAVPADDDAAVDEAGEENKEHRADSGAAERTVVDWVSDGPPAADLSSVFANCSLPPAYCRSCSSCCSSGSPGAFRFPGSSSRK
jgi:hypothetical protein